MYYLCLMIINFRENRNANPEWTMLETPATGNIAHKTQSDDEQNHNQITLHRKLKRKKQKTVKTAKKNVISHPIFE